MCEKFKKIKLICAALITIIAISTFDFVLSKEAIEKYIYSNDGSSCLGFISLSDQNVDGFFTLQSDSNVSDVTIEYNSDYTSATLNYNPSKYSGLDIERNSRYTRFSSGDEVNLQTSGQYYLIPAKNVTIPSVSPNGKSVTQIGKYALYNDVTTNTFTLPNSIRKINENAFEGCTNLYSIDLSYCHNLNDIAEGAFSNIGNDSVIIYIGNNAELYYELTGNSYSENASSTLKLSYGNATVKASTI